MHLTPFKYWDFEILEIFDMSLLPYGLQIDLPFYCLVDLHHHIVPLSGAIFHYIVFPEVGAFLYITVQIQGPAVKNSIFVRLDSDNLQQALFGRFALLKPFPQDLSLQKQRLGKFRVFCQDVLDFDQSLVKAVA